MQKPRISTEQRAFHDSLIVIDGHCDTVLELVGESWREPKSPPKDFLLRSEKGHIDLPRLQEAGHTCQAMAMYTSTKLVDRATEWTWKLLEALEAVYARTDAFVPALCAADIRRAKRDGRVAGFLAIEGGEAIGGSEVGIANLEAFYARGVRLMTLTWSRRNALGRGVEASGSDGLSDFGREVVSRMEELGMIVDASHLADQSLLDLLEVAKGPVVASHSNSRVLCPHPRNLSDELAKGIAATGGLVALTFPGDYIDPVPIKVSFGRLMEHVEYMMALLGPEHVGIGSDFDGWDDRFGVALPDCSWMPFITAALLEKGHSPEEVAAVMGGNWLRVIEQVTGA